MTVTIKNEMCDRCGTCIAVCPSNALMLTAQSLEADQTLCTGCGRCINICPFGALSLHDH